MPYHIPVVPDLSPVIQFCPTVVIRRCSLRGEEEISHIPAPSLFAVHFDDLDHCFETMRTGSFLFWPPVILCHFCVFSSFGKRALLEDGRREETRNATGRYTIIEAISQGNTDRVGTNMSDHLTGSGYEIKLVEISSPHNQTTFVCPGGRPGRLPHRRGSALGGSTPPCSTRDSSVSDDRRPRPVKSCFSAGFKSNHPLIYQQRGHETTYLSFLATFFQFQFDYSVGFAGQSEPVAQGAGDVLDRALGHLDDLKSAFCYLF